MWACEMRVGDWGAKEGYQTGWSRGVDWEDRAVGQWRVGAASKPRGSSSGNLGPRFGMVSSICQVGDRGSRIADWMRIRTEGCLCTVQDHHPTSIIIQLSVVLSRCKIQKQEAQADRAEARRRKRDDHREYSSRGPAQASAQGVITLSTETNMHPDVL